MSRRFFVHVSYPIECQEKQDEVVVSPIAKFELPDGEIMELKYPEGKITTKEEKNLGAMSCPISTLLYKDEQFPIGFCLGGSVRGYEAIIFDQIKRSIYAQVKKHLSKFGVRQTKFTPCGYGKIQVEII